MKTLFVLCTFLSAQLFYSAKAQQPASPAYAAQDLPEASFAVVVDSKMLTTEENWKQSTRLREYAMTRPGTYIVFATRNRLALLTNAGALSKALSLYQEVARLGNEQKSLEAKQAPLTKQQEVLAAQMKRAVSPEEMRRIGAEQGRLGLEQGAIGRDQGRVGQEQGVAGRAFYDEVQASLKTCMQNRGCPAA